MDRSGAVSEEKKTKNTFAHNPGQPLQINKFSAPEKELQSQISFYWFANDVLSNLKESGHSLCILFVYHFQDILISDILLNVIRI